MKLYGVTHQSLAAWMGEEGKEIAAAGEGRVTSSSSSFSSKQKLQQGGVKPGRARRLPQA
jgi:hypothetical protein